MRWIDPFFFFFWTCTLEEGLGRNWGLGDREREGRIFA